jgi:hypothetical protein
MVDATPRHAAYAYGCSKVFERIGGGFYAQFELVVGAVVADENRDGVCVLCPEKRHLDARVLALGEHPSGGGTGGGVIVRVVHVISPVRRSQSTS